MRTGHIISLVAFFALCVWVISLSPRTTRKIQSAALALATPFVRGGSEVEKKIKHFREDVRQSEQVNKENDDLRRELKLARLYASDRREVYEENQRLSRALKYRERSSFELLPAQVIQRDRANWWSTITVDRGFSHPKVAVGAAVLVAEGLVGRILSVAPDASVVLLLTDENCQVAARTLGSNDVRGVVSGSRGNAEINPVLRMGPLPLGTRLEPGRAAITTGSGGVFPANFPIGMVERVEDKNFYSEAVLKPAVDFTHLEQVFIVLAEEKGGQQ